MCYTYHVLTYQIQKRQSSGSMDDRPLTWVREYVESLHQNSRATLLFGKNNVLVQPVFVFLSLAIITLTMIYIHNKSVDNNVCNVSSWKAGASLSGALFISINWFLLCSWTLLQLDVVWKLLLVFAERWHGGHPRLPVSTSNCRSHDLEMDTQSANEWQCWGAGFREKVS